MLFCLLKLILIFFPFLSILFIGFVIVNNVEGVEIHAECLSQDFDDIFCVPIVDGRTIGDPENDVFGYYD